MEKAQNYINALEGDVGGKGGKYMCDQQHNLILKTNHIKLRSADIRNDCYQAK